MHFTGEHENGMNPSNHQSSRGARTATGESAGLGTGTGTTTSCTSSTDSGVIIIDNTTVFNSNRPSSPSINTSKNPSEQSDERLKSYFLCENEPPNQQANSSSTINIENIINLRNGNAEQEDLGPRRVTNTSGSIGSKNCSPAVSIRSTSISIMSIDVNAIDSSVVDTDSEIEADAEGVHSNYVVKKLGQQITYPPNSTELPQLNKGLKVISQTVSPSSMQSPLADNILNGGLCTPTAPMGGGALTPTTPQIGSIALTNSTDVTFGDKHFYEGPVTIQQFLIDSRDKWKPMDEEGTDNPTFAHEHGTKDPDHDSTSKTNSPPSQDQPYKFIFNRKAFIITGAIIVLTILVGILIVAASTIFKTTIRKSKLGDGDDSRMNIPINSTIDTDNIGSGKILRIVPRDGWLAQPPSKPPIPLNSPVRNVIVISTQTDLCTTQAACTYRVRFIQTYNIESLQHDDIIYNFLIGGDGNVYEGRGWNWKGAHLKGFNDDSVSFAYIGTFRLQKPTAKQMNVTRLLLDEGLRTGKLDPDYKIYSANKLDPTSTTTSADALYASFRGWPHWSDNIILD